MPERRLHTDSTELVSHLKELTTALTAVHEDLYWLAMQPPNANDKPAVPAAELNVDLLSDLKSAVDDMRLLLWQYIETAAEVNPPARAGKDGLATPASRHQISSVIAQTPSLCF